MQTVINFPILSFQFCSVLFCSFSLHCLHKFVTCPQYFFFRLSITLFYDSFKRFYVEKVGVLWATLRVVWFFFSFGCDGHFRIFFSLLYGLYHVVKFLRYIFILLFCSLATNFFFLNNKKGFENRKLVFCVKVFEWLQIQANSIHSSSSILFNIIFFIRLHSIGKLCI